MKLIVYCIESIVYYIQMAFSYVASQNLGPLVEKLQESSPHVCSMGRTLFGKKRYGTLLFTDHCCDLQHFFFRISKQPLTENTAIVGGTTLLFLDPTVVHLVNEFLHCIDANGVILCTPERRVRVLYRVEISGQLYSSAHYNRVKRRNTYTVMYTDNDGIDTFGFVQYYILAMDKIVLAVIERLNRLSVSCQEHYQLTSSALDSVSCLGSFVVRPSGILNVVKLSNIKEKCLHIELSPSSQYVSRIPPCFHD